MAPWCQVWDRLPQYGIYQGTTLSSRVILGPGLVRNYGQYTLYKYLVMGLELGLSDAGDISEDSS